MLQIGPELGVVHGSFLVLARLLLLSLRQHPRHLGTTHTQVRISEHAVHPHVSSVLTGVNTEYERCG